eukprot:GHRQ01034358.1.p2 GENE.GHRQ01034358.1~~GHRQ01034358.1.p2  ORF type:complete len:120 (-),score=18.88 GHRQ01034358.1:197-556(-)
MQFQHTKIHVACIAAKPRCQAACRCCCCCCSRAFLIGAKSGVPNLPAVTLAHESLAVVHLLPRDVVPAAGGHFVKHTILQARQQQRGSACDAVGSLERLGAVFCCCHAKMARLCSANST